MVEHTYFLVEFQGIECMGIARTLGGGSAVGASAMYKAIHTTGYEPRFTSRDNCPRWVEDYTPYYEPGRDCHFPVRMTDDRYQVVEPINVFDRSILQALGKKLTVIRGKGHFWLNLLDRAWKKGMCVALVIDNDESDDEIVALVEDLAREWRMFAHEIDVIDYEYASYSI